MKHELPTNARALDSVLRSNKKVTTAVKEGEVVIVKLHVYAL